MFEHSYATFKLVHFSLNYTNIAAIAMNDDSNSEQNVKSSDSKVKSKKIVLKVVLLGDEDPLRVKVKQSTSWSKIFTSFANYKGREVILISIESMFFTNPFPLSHRSNI